MDGLRNREGEPGKHLTADRFETVSQPADPARGGWASLPPIAVMEGFTYPSEPLARTYAEIRIPVVLRTSGSWFAGESGQGKSKSVEYCTQALREEFPGMPVFGFNHHMLPATASRSIPIRLLYDVVHAETSGDPTRLRLRLARNLAEQALGSAFRQCVLLFDEAQTLRPQDLFLLKDFSNDLAKLDTGFLAIMFGESPKMEELVDKTRSGDDHGLAERFFVRRLKLHQYESQADWESLLKQVDLGRFPQLGGQTIPEVFLRDALGRPYKMAGEAANVWKAMRARRGREVLSTLRRKFTAIRKWILCAGPLLRQGQALPGELWTEAVAYAACGGD